MNVISRGMEMYLSLPHIIRGEMHRKLLTRMQRVAGERNDRISCKKSGDLCSAAKAGLAEKLCSGSRMYTWNDEAV